MLELTDVEILNAMQHKVRWSQLRDKLYEKLCSKLRIEDPYKRPPSKASFNVSLYRKLNRLEDYFTKMDEGHRKVFYVLNERGREMLKRAEFKRKTDDVLDSVSPEQADRIIEVLRKSLDVALEKLVEKKVMDALNEGREWISPAEIRQVYEDVRRRVKWPKVGGLYGIREKAWHLFLQKKHPDIWQLIKDGKAPTWPKTILRDFDQYLQEEFFKSPSTLATSALEGP